MKFVYKCYMNKTSLCHVHRLYNTQMVVRKFSVLSQYPACKNKQNSCNIHCNKAHFSNLSENKSTMLCDRSNTINQRRLMSIETFNNYFSSEVPPIGFAEKTFATIHDITGLPWWASIVLTTVVLRSAVTLPLSIYSVIIQTRLEKLQPEIIEMSKLLRKEVAHATMTRKWSEKKSRMMYNSTMKKKIVELYIRDNCHPMKTTVGVWTQIPMWVCLSFALRNISGAIPVVGVDAVPKFPELKTEGTLWFQDLTIPDSTLLLPLSFGLFTLLNIEMFSLMRSNPGKLQRRLTIFFRGIALLMIPISSLLPSSMCCYWVTSSFFGLTQNFLLKMPKVRRFLRIAKTPSESATPIKDMLQVAKSKYFKGN